MPLEEAPETTESAAPLEAAGAVRPRCGTLAGASIASVGPLVPSGSALLSPVVLAVALAVTRLAVHTPERRASGSRTIDFCRALSRWVGRVMAAFHVGGHRWMPPRG